MATDTTTAEQTRWLFLMQGVLATLAGLSLLIIPTRTLFVIVLVLGGYWFVRGVATLLYIAADRSQWGWKLFVGVLGIIAGIVAMATPVFTGTAIFAVLVFVIGFQALLSGATEIYFGFKLGRSSLVLLGFLSLLIGAALILNPWLSVAALIFSIGIISLVGGIGTIIAALRRDGVTRPVTV